MRLNYALEGHTIPHSLTLAHTSYADNKKLIKDNLRKDSSN